MRCWRLGELALESITYLLLNYLTAGLWYSIRRAPTQTRKRARDGGATLSQRGVVQGIDYVNQLDANQEKSALNAK